MENFLKRFIFLFALCFALNATAVAENIVGKDAPAGFAWGKVKEDDMSFKLISLDKEYRKIYVQNGDFFAPVEMRPRNFSQLYGTTKKSEVTFYERRELEKPKEGYALYVPILSVSTNSSSDVFFAFWKSSGGTLSATSVDVSLNAMPIPSFSIINFSPYKIGINLGKKAFAMSVFASKTLALESSTERSSKVACVKFYSLKNPKSPSFIEQKSYTFWSYERVIVVVFNQKEESEVPVFAAYNPSKRAGQGTSGSASDILVLTNRGPR